MSFSTGEAFKDVMGDEQTQSTNANIGHTYKIVPYKRGQNFIHMLTEGMHAFIRPVATAGLLAEGQSAKNALLYNAFTVEHLNHELLSLSIEHFNKGAMLYPQRAHDMFKYAGVVAPGALNGTNNPTAPGLPSYRQMVFYTRFYGHASNYWPDCKGTDHIGFMFKFVDCTKLTGVYCLSSEVVLTLDIPNGMRKCVQVVAVRYTDHTPTVKATGRVVGDDEKGIRTSPVSFGLTGMGVHVPVGIVGSNMESRTLERDHETYEIEGVLCNDGTKAHSKHIFLNTLLA